MSIIVEKQRLAKPFLKWAGGKGQIWPEIEKRLPQGIETGEIETYIEPFVGGGAVFFNIAQKYENIKHFYLFDINQDLVNCYNALKNDIHSIIEELSKLERKFLPMKKAAREKFYYEDIRTEFNKDRDPVKLIFLNKTCYNGLYRVNRKDEFNVPFGDYKKPTICDIVNLKNVSQVLQKAEIICADFEKSDKYIDNKTFVYFDPPYRPLSPTASFTAYSKEDFGLEDQVRLALFSKRVKRTGAKLLLSNSDPKNEDSEDHFFEENYKKYGFDIIQVKANRAINCKASGRGQINELLITNF